MHLRVANLDRALPWYTTALGPAGPPPRGRRGRARHRGRRGRPRPARGPRGPARRPAHRPLPLRPAVPLARGAGARRRAPGRHAHPGRGRVGPRDARGDLPAGPRRQRHRAGRRPAARGVAAVAGLRGRPAAARRRGPPRRPSRARSRTRRGRPTGLRVGHVHLHVGDLERGLRFYRDVLGFDVMATRCPAPPSSPPAATTTTSASTPGAAAASPPVPDDVVGLGHWTLVLPAPADVAAVARAARGGRRAGRGPRRRRVPRPRPVVDPACSSRPARRRREPGPQGPMVPREPPRRAPDRPRRAHRARPPAHRRHRPRARLLRRRARLRRRHRRPATCPGWGTTGDLLFVSAGGYHHHLGFNTWKSAGGGPQPDGVAGPAPRRAQLPDRARRSRTRAPPVEAVDWPIRQASRPRHAPGDLPLRSRRQRPRARAGTARPRSGRATPTATSRRVFGDLDLDALVAEAG